MTENIQEYRRVVEELEGQLPSIPLIMDELLRIVAPRLQKHEGAKGDGCAAKGGVEGHAGADLRNPSGSLGWPAWKSFR